MKAALISLGSRSSVMVLEAMKKYFDSVDQIDLRKIDLKLDIDNPEVLYDGKPFSKYDCIYAKGSFRYHPLLRAMTEILGKEAYMPLKPSAFSLASDKLLTQLDIQKHKIPMPSTYLAATPEAAKGILKKIHYPIVMKFPQGTHGKGVMFADSYSSASSMLDALAALKQPFLIQEYIETEGEDIRAFVVGSKVVAAMKRRASIGEKRANIHSGGSAEAYELDADGKKIAVEAAKAIGAEICGVDMLEHVKGYAVLEVNVSPGIQGITKASKIDIANKIAKHLYDQANAIKTTGKKTAAKEIMKEINMADGQEIITNLDFRGNRILLPELITKATNFSQNDEFILTINKKEVRIRKAS